MADDLIRYDVLVQESLRGVVRKVLKEVAESGLPGDHHFYIAFDTGAPGVRISSRLREQYPEEMTVVMQHQFWELSVTEHAFEVGLSFGGVPERLLVPFSSIKGFFDPSVQFGLQFEPHETDEAKEGSSADIAATPAPAAMQDDAPGGAPDHVAEEAADVDERPDGAEVVSLDAFRKKT
ncbi:SspB family protein [Amorphus coralli]|uniref:SspB family protein n=1 Tax=Amorphus coralli TaxID=340680 RepID=UPI00035D4D0F|nr:SspB family protein [Amorphus coralli]